VRQHLIALGVVVLTVAGSASAATLKRSTPTRAHAAIVTMTCQGPFSGYVVKYDVRNRRMTLDHPKGPTRYSVTSVDRSHDWFAVSGRTVNGGPRYQAIFVPRKAMVYYNDDGEQTDNCH